MVAPRTWTRAAIVVLMAAGTAVWYACGDRPSDPLTGPSAAPHRGAPPDLGAAIAAQQRHTDALLRVPGVVGTAVGVHPDGRAGIQILLERPGIAGLPPALDGIPVAPRVTGRLVAYSDPTGRQRPAPLGFSVGHPAITAGTIGARVRDALGRVYILSNNHVLANSNAATIGDPAYQPGPFDGGTAADQIAVLSDFQPITFATTANNTIDAAVALSSTDQLGNASPGDDGYGVPNATIFGDADGDGVFDDRNALLGLNVQKYGRTTRLTHGQITGVNASVLICYEVSGFDCTKFARFVDQVIIEPGTFSGGGDSGSLIVTDDPNLYPVALLFAGSATVTVANRIDLVLNRFGVSIDGFAPPPPGPLTDVAVVGVGVPGPVVLGDTAPVTVTVKNFGNQDVPAPFDVTLRDTTENVTVGSRSVAGLAPGASVTVTFDWTPASTGEHTLVGSHTAADDKPANDRSAATVAVLPQVTDVAVTGVAVPGAVSEGKSVNVAVTVGNVGNQDVGSGFVVTLEDATAGVTIGSQTVMGLAAGASASLTFSWNTTGAALGSHTLVATHSLPDDNTANNQRSAVVSVNPKLIDVALTGVTGPASVTQGETAHIRVTVQNVGEQDVTASFDVVLTDGFFGPTIGTQTVAGLALGASTTLDFAWNTTGVEITGHTLFARHLLADGNSTNNAAGIGITVKAPVTLVTDVAVTDVTAPGTVSQGQSVNVAVTVSNVGNQDVGNGFVVTLQDATDGVTLGSRTVTGLPVGTSSTLSFGWNTSSATLGSHTLVATHDLADADAANNQRSAVVSVKPKVADIAVTNLTGPASVTQGNTTTIGVTVQNVGELDAAAGFDVVLTDATAGVTIGSQTVTGLAVGATTTLSFSWNTTGAALGSHTLVATHSLTDDNAANNQRSAVVSVNPKLTDIALTGITAPASVTQGDTAHIGVTVKNVGDQDVTATFDVVVTDGFFGATIGTQAVAGLAVGAGAVLDFPWNTAGVEITGHTLFARQMLADGNPSNDAGAIGITVNPPSVHVGDLAGFAAHGGNTWSATVEITVHDARHDAVNGVTVNGSWGGSNSGTCTTGEAGGVGICRIVYSSIPNPTKLVSFAVSGMTRAGYVYKPAANHDPDGSSNGTTIFVRR
ncbi:MAG: CARDB domain-containing protein [Gemmatimonadales bacterium]